MRLIQCYDIRVKDDFLEIFAVNLQSIPNLGNVWKRGDELILIVRVAVTLPAYEIRTSPVTW